MNYASFDFFYSNNIVSYSLWISKIRNNLTSLGIYKLGIYINEKKKPTNLILFSSLKFIVKDDREKKI